jgi:hypothetical protein
VGCYVALAQKERLMVKSEQRKLIENAAEELACLIRKINDDLKSNITSTDLDEPDYYDYQTCYELMALAKEL